MRPRLSFLLSFLFFLPSLFYAQSAGTCANPEVVTLDADGIYDHYPPYDGNNSFSMQLCNGEASPTADYVYRFQPAEDGLLHIELLLPAAAPKSGRTYAEDASLAVKKTCDADVNDILLCIDAYEGGELTVEAGEIYYLILTGGQNYPGYNLRLFFTGADASCSYPAADLTCLNWVVEAWNTSGATAIYYHQAAGRIILEGPNGAWRRSFDCGGSLLEFCDSDPDSDTPYCGSAFWFIYNRSILVYEDVSGAPLAGCDSQGLDCACTDYRTGNICEGFETYIPDEVHFTEQAPCWTTWTGVSGSSIDAVVNYGEGTGGGTALEIRDGDDVALLLGDRTTGKYSLSFKIRLKEEKAASFTLLQQFVPNETNADEQWAYEVFLLPNDLGVYEVQGNQVQFDYDASGWIDVNSVIDLDNDLIILYVNYEEIGQWPYSFDANNTSTNPKVLDALDFYSYDSRNWTYEFFVDDVLLTRLDLPQCSENPLSYPWVQELIGNSDCAPCSRLLQAEWEGNSIFIYEWDAYACGWFDAGSTTIYDCEGNILQTCSTTLAGNICDPYAGIVSWDNERVLWECPNTECTSPIDPQTVEVGHSYLRILWVNSANGHCFNFSSNDPFDGFEIRYREAGSAWNNLITLEEEARNFYPRYCGWYVIFPVFGPYPEIHLNQLKPCTDYEFQIRSVKLDDNNTNVIDATLWSAVYTESTTGCGNPYFTNFCHAVPMTAACVNLERIQIAAQEITLDYSESAPPWGDYGYDYDPGFSFQMAAGESHEFDYGIAMPDYGISDQPTEFRLKVWIDLNGDGDYQDADETLLNNTGQIAPGTSGGFADIFSLPVMKATTSRMRIAFVTPVYGSEELADPGPCDIFPAGRILEYDIEITPVEVPPCSVEPREALCLDWVYQYVQSIDCAAQCPEYIELYTYQGSQVVQIYKGGGCFPQLDIPRYEVYSCDGAFLFEYASPSSYEGFSNPVLLWSCADPLPDCTTGSAAVTMTVTPDRSEVCAGETLCADFQVKDFSDISETRFTITWDPAVLAFQSVADLNPLVTGLDVADFNTSEVDQGRLYVEWKIADCSTVTIGQGITLDDCSGTCPPTLFRVCFSAISGDGGATTLSLAPDRFLGKDNTRCNNVGLGVEPARVTTCGSVPSDCPVVYQEDFSSDPNFTSLSGEHAYWDETAGEYVVETYRNLEEQYWAYSPEFPTTRGSDDLTIEMDILCEKEVFATYPGVYLFGEEPTDIDDPSRTLRVYYAWASVTDRKLQIVDYQANNSYLSTQSYEENQWYHVRIDYRGEMQKADIRIVERGTGNVFYEVSNVDFIMDDAAYFAVGYYGPTYRPEASPIRMDNLLIERCNFVASPCELSPSELLCSEWLSDTIAFYYDPSYGCDPANEGMVVNLVEKNADYLVEFKRFAPPINEYRYYDCAGNLVGICGAESGVWSCDADFDSYEFAASIWWCFDPLPNCNEPPWEPQPCTSGNTHFISVLYEHLESDIGGQPLAPGDWLGVFYEKDDGRLVCMDMAQFADPALENGFQLSVCAESGPGADDGFAADEPFRFKVYKNGEEYDAGQLSIVFWGEGELIPPVFPDAGSRFEGGGKSSAIRSINDFPVIVPPDCTTPIPIACGQTISGHNGDGTDNAVSYNCFTNLVDGPEVTYAFTLDQREDVLIRLDGLTDDLELLLLDACDRDQCIAKSERTGASPEVILYPDLPPGDYFIVVDGYVGYESPYNLSLDCGDYPQGEFTCPPETISCGQIVNGRTAEGCSEVNFYNCSEAYTPGRENVYRVRFEERTNARIVLEPRGADLELFLLDALDPNRCLYYSNESGEETERIVLEPSELILNRDYYIVVDGFYADRDASFQLAVECIPPGEPCPWCPPQPGICDEAIEITCNETVSGHTRDGSSRVAKWGDCPSYNEGPELIYRFHNPQTQDVEIILSDFTENLNFYVLRDQCSVNACDSDWAGNKSGLIKEDNLFKPLPQGDYFIIVDSYDAPSSFSLQVKCKETAPCFEVDVEQGFSYISSNRRPGDDPSIENILPKGRFEGVSIILSDDRGNTFDPHFSTPRSPGTIEEWRLPRGYRIDVSEPITLEFCGEEADPAAMAEVIALSAAGEVQKNLIGYPFPDPMPVTEAFAGSPAGNLFSVSYRFPNDGQRYLDYKLALDIGDDFTMEPGKGYFLVVTEDGDFSFRSEERAFMPNGCSYFRTPLRNTLERAFIRAPGAVLAQSLQPEDEIGIFTKEGVLCGSGKFLGGNLIITLLGDDPQTGAREGFMTGEEMQARIWRSADGKVEDVVLEFANHSAEYESNDIYLLKSISTRQSKDVYRDYIAWQFYPNPANDHLYVEYMLPSDGAVQLQLYSVDGRIQRSITDVGSAGVHQVSIDVEAFTSGLYFLQLTAGSYSETRKVILQK